ncbi:ATP-binding cassette domain-containing protein [Microbacterium sp. LRZ72]|uniref:ATP-binding cassette domain-containing protein n=1 Tax=Microbacterium sp. LRZ72 TaxID=2942481 RepID=UPI0029AB7A3B|nr:ATP-binding cassette domain-containing protein [Microbacterium sp. LRZ72]MDX2377522.1 ATP-binding cassette domain-containing protein [Microbacterium sp. LRZ72]
MSTATPATGPGATATATKPLLSVKDLDLAYDKPSFFPWIKKKTTIVKGVSFDIAPGETLGLVGESGSGKSTTGRAILRMMEVDGGTIRFDERDVTGFGKRTPLSYRREVQAVFQDPASSLNPRLPVSSALTDAMKRHGIGDSAEERERRAATVFDQVGLQAAHLTRYPFELSGGQQQRVAIARALVLEPKLIVCDEAVSALDLSTQSQIINLLADLQDRTGLSYLFVAHDLAIVRHISHRIAVMQKGRIVELADTHSIFEHPQHPYTRRLIGASPADHPEGRDERRARRREFRLMRETGLGELDE